ncbi:ROK family protein [Pseudomonas luteola]|uniref:ROK family protein n=1 Tax=Pseudomonas luteola TaxID=47886 RepID=UPI003A85EA95
MTQALEKESLTMPDQGVLLAIDVGGTKTHIACYDPASEQLATRALATHAKGMLGEPALMRLLEAARECAQQLGATTICSVAGVFPGVVRDHTLLMAPNTPGFEGLDLHGLIAQGLGTPAVMLDNDVKAGALAEARWGSLQGIDHALYLNLGTGLSAAAIANGQLIRGHNGAAMEIGYMLSPFLDPERVSDWYSHEQGGAPLEELFSGTALNQLAVELLGPGHQALDLFTSQEPRAQQALHVRIAACTAQVANLAIALDVGRIAIGGGLYRQAATLAPLIKHMINRTVPFAPEIVTAHFTHDAPLWGALSMAMDAAGLAFIPEQILSQTELLSTPDATASEG